jgi:hypothetical protein
LNLREADGQYLTRPCSRGSFEEEAFDAAGVDGSRGARAVRGLQVGTRVRWMRDAEAADREELRSAAEAAAAQVQPGGVLWFIFIGHGVPAKDAKDGLLVAADARPTPQSVYSRSLAKADLERELLKGAQARTVVLLDACFSGRDGGGGSLLPGI